MKSTTKKQSFFGDFSITKSNYFSSFFSISRLFTLILSLFFSTMLINFNAFSVEKFSQQVPVKKVLPALKKDTAPKIVKAKTKGKKVKKSVVIKKDTLKDIDPASTSSPLYNN